MDKLLLALGNRLGIQISDDRHQFVLADLDRVLKKAGISPSESLHLARSEPLEGDLMSELVRCVTVDESYFFRDPDQLEAVRVKVLPALAQQNAADRRLEAFSAGCSGGEELYSAAILIAEASVFQGWNVRLLGGDACRKAVRKALAGQYSAWSLRGLSGARHQYFRATGKQFQLCHTIRAMADFRVLNLLEELPLTNQDLIFFRNVSIYFPAEVRRQVLERLLAGLKPGGFLVAGAGELALDVPPQLVSLGNSIFRKVAAESPQTPVEPRIRPPASTPHPRPRPRPHSPVAISRADDLAERARRAADRGQMEEAEGDCRLHLQRHPEDKDVHYLLGEILECRQRPAEAIRAWRTVTFLDHQHVMAHFRLGLLLTRTADKPSARRHLTLVERLLEQPWQAPTEGPTREQIQILVREHLRNV